MYRLALILLLPVLAAAQPFTERDIAFARPRGGSSVCTTGILAIVFQTNLTSSADASTFTTPAFTPRSNDTLIAQVAYSPISLDNIGVLTNIGTPSLVWWKAGSNYSHAAVDQETWVSAWPDNTAPAPISLNFSTPGSTMQVVYIHIYGVTNANRSLPYGTNAIAKFDNALVTIPSTGCDCAQFPFTAPSNNGSNAMIFAMSIQLSADADWNFYPSETGWTRGRQSATTGPTSGLLTGYKLAVPSSSTFMWMTNTGAGAAPTAASFIQINCSTNCL